VRPNSTTASRRRHRSRQRTAHRLASGHDRYASWRWSISRTMMRCFSSSMRYRTRYPPRRALQRPVNGSRRGAPTIRGSRTRGPDMNSHAANAADAGSRSVSARRAPGASTTPGKGCEGAAPPLSDRRHGGRRCRRPTFQLFEGQFDGGIELWVAPSHLVLRRDNDLEVGVDPVVLNSPFLSF
jgi:hypothetical protein